MSLSRLRSLFRAPLKKCGKKRGALSLDVIAVIAFLGALSVYIISNTNIMNRDNKVNNLVSSMQLISIKLADMYMNEPSFEGVSDEILIASGNAPTANISADKKSLHTPWGSMTIEAATSDGGSEDDTFSLTLNNIPSEACQRIGSLIASSKSWQTMTINSGQAYDVDEVHEGGLVKYLSDECSESKNTMVFVAKRQ